MRRAPPHPKKGSPEAFAWAKRMQAARRKKGKRNPGVGYHNVKRLEADRAQRSADDKGKEKLGQFFHGKSVAHLESGLEEESRFLVARGKRNPPKRKRCRALPRPKSRTRRNPTLAIYGLLGNPPREIRARIEGVVYNRLIEIKAQKTGFQKGFYRHTFNGATQACIMALDNGDLLIHSRGRKPLWKVDR